MAEPSAEPLTQSRELADGTQMPLLGLGVWQVPNGEECENAVRWALELGYRHIDTAQAYGNEESVGRALKDSGVPREEIFLTTKFYPAHDDPEAEAEHSLRRLGVDQVDLYIIHWPQGGPTWAWPGMERARERGYARSIGVSNFSAGELAEVVAVASTPAGGQPGSVQSVRVSPPAARGVRRARGRARGLQSAGHREAPERSEGPGDRRAGAAHPRPRCCCAGAFSATPIVIPKSTHRERIEENAQIFDFELSDSDLSTLDGLDRTGGTDQAREQKWW